MLINQVRLQPYPLIIVDIVNMEFLEWVLNTGSLDAGEHSSLSDLF
jgi:hypothetical protein